MYRLSTVAPDLVQIGTNISSIKRSSVARAVAEWACRETHVRNVLDFDDIKLLDRSFEILDHRHREKIEKIIEIFDDRYFSESERDGGEVFSQEALLWFGRARAMASFLYSTDAEDEEKFCEALYEAKAATNDIDGIRFIVNSELNND